jgi:hypothetical protein
MGQLRGMPPASTRTRGLFLGGPSPLAGRGPRVPVLPAVLSDAPLLYFRGWIRRPASLMTAGRVRSLQPSVGRQSQVMQLDVSCLSLARCRQQGRTTLLLQHRLALTLHARAAPAGCAFCLLGRPYCPRLHRLGCSVLPVGT